MGKPLAVGVPVLQTGKGMAVGLDPTAKTPIGSSTRIPDPEFKGTGNKEAARTGKGLVDTRVMGRTANVRAKEAVAAGGNFILTFSLL